MYQVINHTIAIALLGIIVGWVGMFGGWINMKKRVLRSRDSLRRVPDLIPRYRRLIKDEGAPRWPLIVSLVCLPLSVVIVFSAILWVR